MKIGVLTGNFRVYNRLLSLLKEMDEPFDSLLPQDEISGFDIVMTDTSIPGNNVFRTDGKDEFRIKQIVKSGNSEEITVGIDPGPAPGIATLANNIVIDRRSIYDISEVRNYVSRIRRECRYSKFVVKVGDGDKRYRNAIVGELRDYDLQIVNERGSSRTTKRGDDASSAINIALSDEVL